MKKFHRQYGFTLVELLAVITIIGILAALVLGVTSYAYKKAKVSRAKAEITAMDSLLESFKNNNGYYPQRPNGDDTMSSTNIYAALAGGSKIYMNSRPDQIRVWDPYGTITNIVDPFGIPYRYLCPGTNNPTGFDIWSYGPDRTNGINGGVNNDLDNISNWQQ